MSFYIACHKPLESGRTGLLVKSIHPVPSSDHCMEERLTGSKEEEFSLLLTSRGPEDQNETALVLHILLIEELFNQKLQETDDDTA